jgi:hypothetical protein
LANHSKRTIPIPSTFAYLLLLPHAQCPLTFSRHLHAPFTYEMKMEQSSSSRRGEWIGGK